MIQAFAPGRVNLIGEHTDYNGGLALPFAIGLGVSVVATPLDAPEIEAIAVDLGERDQFTLPVSSERGHTTVSGWRSFVRGAAAELPGAGFPVSGARLEISTTIPIGAGISASAALSVAVCLALAAIGSGAEPEPNTEACNRRRSLVIAQVCQQIERRWAGAETGLLDQLASLLGRSGQATLIDFRSLDFEPVPMNLDGHRIVVLDSGEAHDNSTSGYNLRRSECVEAAHRMGKESLRDTQIQDLHLLPDVLAHRARHVISENVRVEEAVSALRTRNFERLGRLLDASHSSLRDDFEVSTPAVDAAVETLKQAGALGARLLGGGFGGSALGLFPPGCKAPAGALEVTPSAGAHVL